MSSTFPAGGLPDAELGFRAGRRVSIPLQLARTARRAPGSPALRHDDGHELSYRQLDERANRLARVLAGHGVGRGDRVAILMHNRTEVVEAWLAALRLGAIVVPLNFRSVPSEVAHLLTDSGARLLVTEDALYATALAGLDEAGADCAVIRCGGASAGTAGGGLRGAEEYESALAAHSPDPILVDVPETDPAFLMYTSGTTGRPKGAVLTHLNLYLNSLDSGEVQPIGPTDRGLLNIPLFHIAGVNFVLNHLFADACLVMAPGGTFDASRTVDLLERESISGCFFVPSQWKAICEVPGVRERRLALRRISWGASAAPPSVLAAMAETFPGVPIISAFGQTEMSSVTTLLRGEDAVRKTGSVGRPVRHVDVRIVDENMDDVPVGQVGEAVYRGGTVMREYWNNPRATAEAFAGGWFHSGDLCRMDDEGFLYVVDRKKDMIVSGGENIYSAEVEAVIDGHPGVAEVAVVGVPHPRWVETPRAYVVPRDPAAPPTEQEIVDHCRNRLASYKKPTSVVFLPALPRNASGKVLKADLRRLAT